MRAEWVLKSTKKIFHLILIKRRTANKKISGQSKIAELNYSRLSETTPSVVYLHVWALKLIT